MNDESADVLVVDCVLPIREEHLAEVGANSRALEIERLIGVTPAQQAKLIDYWRKCGVALNTIRALYELPPLPEKPPPAVKDAKPTSTLGGLDELTRWVDYRLRQYDDLFRALEIRTEAAIERAQEEYVRLLAETIVRRTEPKNGTIYWVTLPANASPYDVSRTRRGLFEFAKQYRLDYDNCKLTFLVFHGDVKIEVLAPEQLKDLSEQMKEQGVVLDDKGNLVRR